MDSTIIYSAHWDIRPLHGMQPPFVRILGYTVTGLHMTELLATDFQCKFYFGNTSTSSAPGKIIRHQKSDRSDKAVFVLCPAQAHVAPEDANLEAIPISVGLSCKGCYDGAPYQVC